MSLCSVCQAPLPAGAPSCPRCGAATARVSLGERGTLPGAAVARPTSLGERGTLAVGKVAPAAPPGEVVELDFGEPAAPAPAAALADQLVELRPGAAFRVWDLSRPYYSVGREGAKIALADPRVSRRHLALALVGDRWLVINRSDRRLRVNLYERFQASLRHGDVLRVGGTWLVFLANVQRHAAAPRLLPGGLGRMTTLDSLDDDRPAAQLSLYAGGRLLAASTGQPLLLGGHPGCAVGLSGAGVAPFHAQLTWLPDGVHVVDLDSGLGTLLDGEPVRDGVVRDGQQIRLGEQQVLVRLAGEPASAPPPETGPPAVHLSAIYGPHQGQTAALPAGRAVRLGRSPQAEVSLPGEKQLAGLHVEVTVQVQADGRPVLWLRDLGGRGDVLVNRERVGAVGTATVGDVLQFGAAGRVSPTALLVHLDPAVQAY